MLQISREVLNDSTWLAVADKAINSPLIKKKKKGFPYSERNYSLLKKSGYSKIGKENLK